MIRSFYSPATVDSNVVKDYSKVNVVVDMSTFRPDSEAVRALKVNPSSGSSGVPVYDYNDGTVPDDDPVSPEIIALRSGKLDKADVYRLKEKIENDAKAKADKEHSDKLLEAVDKTLGITGSSDSENSVQ